MIALSIHFYNWIATNSFRKCGYYFGSRSL